MLLDNIDLECLKLIAFCKDVSKKVSQSYESKVFSYEVIKQLQFLGLISGRDNRVSFRLTSEGYEFLKKFGFEFSQDKHSKAVGTALTRRINLSDLVLVFHRAGIKVFADGIGDLNSGKAVYLPSFVLRRSNTQENLLCNTTFAGILRCNSTAYFSFYISNPSTEINLNNELKTVEKLLLNVKGVNSLAGIFAGKSYEDILSNIFSVKKNAVSAKRNAKKNKHSIPISKALYEINAPVHLLSCNEIGAKQFLIMQVPNHIKMIAKSILHNTNNPMLQGSDGDCQLRNGKYIPAIIGIDMNIKRIVDLANAATAAGLSPLAVFLLREQCGAMKLLRILTNVDIKICYYNNALFEHIALYEPPLTATTDLKGGYIHNDYFKKPAKTVIENTPTNKEQT